MATLDWEQENAALDGPPVEPVHLAIGTTHLFVRPWPRAPSVRGSRDFPTVATRSGRGGRATPPAPSTPRCRCSRRSSPPRAGGPSRTTLSTVAGSDRAAGQAIRSRISAIMPLYRLSRYHPTQPPRQPSTESGVNSARDALAGRTSTRIQAHGTPPAAVDALANAESARDCRAASPRQTAPTAPRALPRLWICPMSRAGSNRVWRPQWRPQARLVLSRCPRSRHFPGCFLG
jgi:hypothetical protein